MTAVPPEAAPAGEDTATTADATGSNDGRDNDTEDYEPTGVTAADDAAARLRDLDGATVDQHVEIYEDAHQRLEEGLADLDER